MEYLILAFVTGLTTGGLSCLAVQGGVLATSLERHIEQGILEKNSPGNDKNTGQPRLAMPIFLFLVAKLVMYTLMGFLLGALGSILQLTSTTRALLLILVGIFMIGNALRMLDIHPFFRIFTIEPPRFITRFIRRKAKNRDNHLTSLFLGALTVFIPCGVTQAMMAAAVGTGNAFQGAAMMFAFTLGTSPVFFTVAYLALKIGARLEKWFLRFVAIVILVLGLVSIDSGANLMGFQYSVTNMFQKIFQPVEITDIPSTPNYGTLILNATNRGYVPREIHAQVNTSLTLNVITQNTTSCSRAFVIPGLQFETLLPTTGMVSIDVPPQQPGTEMQFTCSMGMYTGTIVFDQ